MSAREHTEMRGKERDEDGQREAKSSREREKERQEDVRGVKKR